MPQTSKPHLQHRAQRCAILCSLRQPFGELATDAPMEKMRGSRVLSVFGNQRCRFRRSLRKPEPASAGATAPASSGVRGSKCATSSAGMPGDPQRQHAREQDEATQSWTRLMKICAVLAGEGAPPPRPAAASAIRLHQQLLRVPAKTRSKDPMGQAESCREDRGNAEAPRDSAMAAIHASGSG